ncbi:endolytic transglycosylase MltG [Paenibacillaceae bacterium T2]|uniref:Endolytic murein transglycosylase n=2 Tax=Ferviditalea candida TaxID=3108399 RepID=A0ABU5ZL21_9BACL|nr:endolytic transglycosylase MltG [Paenibacillaceae bacterium T2]
MTQQEETKPDAQEHPKRIMPKAAVWTIIVVLLFLGAVGASALYAVSALQPVKASMEEVHITIDKGMNSSQIASLLEQNGLIRNGFIFKLYLKYRNEGQHFQAGEYAVTKGTPLDEIIRMLNSGDTVKEETDRFTIPEGYTAEQIADKLAELKIADKSKFLRLVSEPKQFSAKYINDIPVNASIKYPLEGYLFPETYELKKGSSEKDIIERMLLEFDKRIDSLPVGWRKQLDKLGIGFHQMLTVASLVEREVVLPEERPIVAGVIYNRLHDKPPMMLQIDATVQYALGHQKEKLIEGDLYQTKSPYNTYLHEGLPPGPIASPSISAIQAALYPEKTKYFFYVTKKDGTNAHYFAETLPQHLKNIEISKKNASKIGQK